MSFAGCDDLVVDKGTADMVAVMSSQPCKDIGRADKYGLDTAQRSEECKSVVEMCVNECKTDHTNGPCKVTSSWRWRFRVELQHGLAPVFGKSRKAGERVALSQTVGGLVAER